VLQLGQVPCSGTREAGVTSCLHVAGRHIMFHVRRRDHLPIPLRTMTDCNEPETVELANKSSHARITKSFCSHIS